ncbi:MAG: rRNA adenine N-6-methyltransferase family protein [Terriglobales bacterium]|jgi:protein-L-isoaspartate(D-aspartate) O-methyltransferase
MTLEQCRLFYAEEIRFTGNIQSPALIEAFARVPREKFLGSGPWEIASAEIRAMAVGGGIQTSYTPIDDPRQLYHNVVVVLDKAADINHGQPSALARWIEAMELKPGDRAYHLGSGVGYYTAIIAEMVGPRGGVAAAEVRPDLATRARENLSCYPNVKLIADDGATVDPDECDAMLINAGMTHPSPLWLDRLRDGGRLVVPLTMATTATLGVGVMAKIIRQGRQFSAQVITPIGIYSCTSMRDALREPVLRTAMTSGALMKMKSVRRDAHEPSDTCLVHGADVCLSSAAAG